MKSVIIIASILALLAVQVCPAGFHCNFFGTSACPIGTFEQNNDCIKCPTGQWNLDLA